MLYRLTTSTYKILHTLAKKHMDVNARSLTISNYLIMTKLHITKRDMVVNIFIVFTLKCYWSIGLSESVH